MTTQTEVLKLALDEIKRVKEICLREVGIGLCNEIVIAKLEEALEQEKALQALHDENERLGLYKDAYAQPEQREPTKKENYLLMGALKRSGKVVAQPEQEPVALYENIPTFYVRDVNGAYVEDSPLNYYITPPQRKPLTDEQLLNAYLKANGLEFYKSFARAIEAAHGIKE